MSTIEKLLDEMQLRADNATPGPWHECCLPYTLGSNATFVAFARTDNPRLVAALREAINTLEIVAKTGCTFEDAADCKRTLKVIKRILKGEET